MYLDLVRLSQAIRHSLSSNPRLCTLFEALGSLREKHRKTRRRNIHLTQAFHERHIVCYWRYFVAVELMLIDYWSFDSTIKINLLLSLEDKVDCGWIAIAIMWLQKYHNSHTASLNHIMNLSDSAIQLIEILSIPFQLPQSIHQSSFNCYSQFMLSILSQPFCLVQRNLRQCKCTDPENCFGRIYQEVGA